MTEIRATADNGKWRISADNHAKTAEVCTAVSAILYTLEGALLNNDHAYEHKSMLEPGRAYIESAGDNIVEEDFRMALIGLMQIEKANPDQISIRQNFF